LTEAPTGRRLYAVVEVEDGARERLAAALADVELAAVLIAPPAGMGAGQRLEASAARPLVAQARQAGVAALVLDDSGLARAVGADGVHLKARDDPQAACRAAREALGAGAVVGGDAGISRHAAMVLAEAGADYVGFGAPPHLKDRDKARARREELITWWAPLFEVPCVAFDVETPEEALQMTAAGADFIAVTLPAGFTAEAVRALVRAVAGAAQSGKEPS
jgi:thiamine-phosphate pyrophosphorylase